MRAFATSRGVDARPGAADATGLPAKSVDAVAYFQAFHWFAASRDPRGSGTRLEARRPRRDRLERSRPHDGVRTGIPRARTAPQPAGHARGRRLQRRPPRAALSRERLRRSRTPNVRERPAIRPRRRDRAHVLIVVRAAFGTGMRCARRGSARARRAVRGRRRVPWNFGTVPNCGSRSRRVERLARDPVRRALRPNGRSEARRPPRHRGRPHRSRRRRRGRGSERHALDRSAVRRTRVSSTRTSTSKCAAKRRRRASSS